MKKFFLAGIVALAMGFAFVSCNQKSDAPVDIKTDGTTKAKADGANWTIDQWKYVFKQAAIAFKPLMVKMAELTDGLGGEGAAEKMAEFEKFAGEYEPVEALMDEFNKIAESCSNGKAVLDDKDFGKQLTDEIGLPDL